MSDPFVSFFLTAAPSVIQLELIEVTHPDFSQAYRYVRNQRGGVTVSLPGVGLTFFEFRPLAIRRTEVSDDLVSGLALDIGDPGDVLPTELDRLVAASSMSTKPALRYWVYRSDDLNTPLVGPLVYEVRSISTKGPNASLEAGAPERNASGTGEIYTFTRFPMLRGFL